MYQHKDFTLDPNNFPQSKMAQFVDDLHNKSMHYGMFIATIIILYKDHHYCIWVLNSSNKKR